MQTRNRISVVHLVLFSNGVVDIGAATALFFPMFNLPLPGYSAYPIPLAFIAGGWGIAALTFGIGRIWASSMPECYGLMVNLGLIEGSILAIFCVLNVVFFGITLLQALLPLAIGSVYAILYAAAKIALFRLNRPHQS
ncbi:MAG: hypothetical protein EHM72_11610 [Calditrichaeota bacterium]|nr:MAG: hypothetical protein EHM72_21065 [Calditrichota bacterium]RPH99243.1 MAG: hypothetical protein EHM72_11610 [Calditrichota bacterium]